MKNDELIAPERLREIMDAAFGRYLLYLGTNLPEDKYPAECAEAQQARNIIRDRLTRTVSREWVEELESKFRADMETFGLSVAIDHLLDAVIEYTGLTVEDSREE